MIFDLVVVIDIEVLGGFGLISIPLRVSVPRLGCWIADGM